MHERSFIKGLIEQVLEEQRIRGLGAIRSIQLQVGEFSGMEPCLIELAFAEMRPEYWQTEVAMVVETIPLTAICKTCQAEFGVLSFRFICPRCGERDVTVTGGEELQITSLTIESPQVDPQSATGRQDQVV